jgi:hypothetical protein
MIIPGPMQTPAIFLLAGCNEPGTNQGTVSNASGRRPRRADHRHQRARH